MNCVYCGETTCRWISQRWKPVSNPRLWTTQRNSLYLGQEALEYLIYARFLTCSGICFPCILGSPFMAVGAYWSIPSLVPMYSSTDRLVSTISKDFSRVHLIQAVLLHFFTAADCIL